MATHTAGIAWGLGAGETFAAGGTGAATGSPSKGVSVPASTSPHVVGR